MTNKELIKQIARVTESDRGTVEKILQATFQLIDRNSDLGTVCITGFGTFSKKDVKPRRFFIPSLQTFKETAPSRRLSFRASGN